MLIKPVTIHTYNPYKDTTEEDDEVDDVHEDENACYTLFAKDPNDADGEIHCLKTELENDASASLCMSVSRMMLTDSTIDLEDIPGNMIRVPSGRFKILPPPAYYSSDDLKHESDFDIMAFDSVTQREHTLVSGRVYGCKYYPSAGVEFDDAPFLSDSDDDDS